MFTFLPPLLPLPSLPLQHDLFTCVHKHYSVDEWTTFAGEHPEVLGNIAISSGSGQEDYSKLKELVARVPGVKYICLDVANGYSEHFVTLVRQARKDFPKHSIMVSPPHSSHAPLLCKPLSLSLCPLSLPALGR